MAHGESIRVLGLAGGYFCPLRRPAESLPEPGAIALSCAGPPGKPRQPWVGAEGPLVGTGVVTCRHCH